MSWESVIGLEVHARLLTHSKMFCACSTAFGAPPNTNICPVCLAYPGALPVMNRRALELGMRMAVATDSQIQPSSQFARKNYFYPDLPKGYQISQFERPLAVGGSVTIGANTVRLTRIHLEEDAGKLVHEPARSLVDLNRSGTPLIEIVSEPDIRSAADASAYFTRLRQILMYAGVCDGNMEEGSLRCDANVSMRRMGEPLGTRVEIKNLNSFRFLKIAIEYEIARQTALIEGGGKVVQETRLFDANKNETRPMRTKEEAHDYRYFPDPDLLEVGIEPQWIEDVRRAVPELPRARSARYQRDFGLSEVDAEILVVSLERAE
jgi:aspartyl-tRNA(Asn)/glutamyl-tRNA(Gln) amidotransferase subunit B